MDERVSLTEARCDGGVGIVNPRLQIAGPSNGGLTHETYRRRATSPVVGCGKQFARAGVFVPRPGHQVQVAAESRAWSGSPRAPAYQVPGYHANRQGNRLYRLSVPVAGMTLLGGVVMPRPRERMCRENYIAAMERKRQDTEHDYLMRTVPEYRAAYEEQERERKRRVDTMAKRSNGGKQVTAPKVGEYKGYPTLTLPNGSKHGFTFGLNKARAILEHLDAIKAFVGDEIKAAEVEVPF